MSNPLDVSTQVQPFTDASEPPGEVLGIPGFISQDAFTQVFVTEIMRQYNLKNKQASDAYHGLLAMWKSDNEHGVYHPAPGPVTLAAINQVALGQWLNGVKGTSDKIVSFYQSFDPAIPPGTVFQPAPPPPPPDKTAESVGPLLPGTYDIYAALGGPYAPSEDGKPLQTPAGAFVLINMSPMGNWEPAWKKA